MSLKKGKSVGVDNILAEPVQAGGGGGGGEEEEICDSIWRTAYPMDSVVGYYTP